MKTKFVTILFLIAFTSVGLAQNDHSISSLTSSSKISASVIGGPSAWQECNAKIQRGGDYFPWSAAKPFPWADIQGVWKLRDGVNPYFLKAKVIRTTSNRKILNLSIVSEGNCSKPLAQGIGYIDLYERNVIRAIINDGSLKYQMKIAAFDVRDLEIDSYACGENVVVASIQPIGQFKSNRSSFLGAFDSEPRVENLMLKKTSNDIASICRKLDSK